MNSENPLANLRGLHSPEAISLWPLAPGWYILIFILLLCLGYWLFRKWQVKQAKHQVLTHLQGLLIKAEQIENNPDIIREMSTLLRRVALKKFPRKDIAGLHGPAWLKFLDETGKTEAFTKGEGAILVSGPYQANLDTNLKPVIDIVKQWVQKNV